MASKAYAVLEQEAGLSDALTGRDLCSIADLSPAEVAAILELGHDVKANPENYRHALDAKQMVMFFEKSSLRTRLTFETAINTTGRNRNLCRPDAVAPRRTRVPCRHGAQPRTLGLGDRPAHVRARNDHRNGAIRKRPHHQCVERPGASLPGAGRFPDARTALRHR